MLGLAAIAVRRLRIHAVPAAIALVSLAIRLVWVIWVHRPADYMFSDMLDYIDRAQFALAHPRTPEPFAAFFAPGTHLAFAGALWLSDGNLMGPGILLALLGAPIPLLVYHLAGELQGGPSWLDPTARAA